MASDLTHESLLSRLRYEPESGRFFHRVRSGKALAGTEAGWIKKTCQYRYISVNGKKYLAHRLAWFYVTGSWPVAEIDHINGMRADNRWENLRDVSRTINHQNLRRPHRDNKLGILGVRKFGNSFTSCIHAGGRLIHLGTFRSPEQASEAYLSAKRKLHEGNTL